jgi:hypothetical protein
VEWATRVTDWSFRAERSALASQYHQWSADDFRRPDVAFEKLAEIVSPDDRGVFIDYLAGRWAASGQPANHAALKALVPLAMYNGTVLDSVLARYVGVHLRELTNDQVIALIRTCNKHLTTGRPWEKRVSLGGFA